MNSIHAKDGAAIILGPSEGIESFFEVVMFTLFLVRRVLTIEVVEYSLSCRVLICKLVEYSLQR